MSSMEMTGKKKTGKQLGAEIVRISLGVALLMPWADVVNAQLAVNCTRNLNFDAVAGCGAGGTLQVQPDGGLSIKGCVAVFGTPQEARCTIQSFTTNGSLQVQVTAKKTSVTGPDSMDVLKFNVGTDGGGPTKTYTAVTLTATPLAVGIGANLVVNPGQLNGVYNGQLMLQVVFTP